MDIKTIDVSKVKMHGDAQPRVQMNMFTVDEYADAMKDGVVFPPIVVFAENGHYWLADGFHRLDAAKRAGKDKIQADVKDGGLRDAVLYSVGANADHGLRRTNQDKRNAVMKLIKDPEWSQWSDREIARICSVSDRFVNGLRQNITANIRSDNGRKYTDRWGNVTVMNTDNIGKPSPSEKIEPEARELIANTLFADDPHNIKRLANMEPDRQINIAEVVAEMGFTNVHKAWSEINQQATTEKVNNLPDISERYQLYCCPVNELHQHITPKSVDVIVTDPPYPMEYVYLYQQLSELSSYALKDGGLLVAMVGKEHLPEYMDGLSRHLDYHWLAPFMMTQTARVWNRNVYTAYKPLLIYSNGDYSGGFFNDVIRSEEVPDKSLHEWEQSKQGMLQIVERFSKPGDIILDPFCGSGTTGIAALESDCVFIGADKEQHAIDITKGRIANFFSYRRSIGGSLSQK